MKRFSNIEVEIEAHSRAELMMCNYGVKNAERIAYRVWKWLKTEKKRQKEKSCKDKTSTK